MASKSKKHNKMMIIGQITRVVHRLIELIGRALFLLAAKLCGPVESPIPIDNPIFLHSASILAMKIRSKQITSEEVVKLFIERIKAVQPALNCVVEYRFEEALREARQCDELLKSSNAPSAETLAKEKPFFGVPFTTKDCVSVANMKQTAGLVIRKNTRAERDSDVIHLMRLAGAIPLATTNVSELAMWWETSNCLYGTTRNPYNARHIVGGSSGGEGCIQAIAASPFGIGSDIGGSIRMPCFFNGIFGHKPSQGIVSNDGQYPSAHTAEQNRLLGIGPMCRHAQDMSAILQVIAHKNADKLNLQSEVDISKLKLYYMEDDGGQFFVSPVDPEIKEAMRRVLNYFEKAHKVKATKLHVSKMKKSLALWLACMTTTDGKDFCYEMSNRNGHVNILWEFVKWFLRVSNHTLIALLTATFQRFGIKQNSAEYVKLMQESRDLYQEFKDVLGEDGIFLYPTHPTAAPLHHEPIIKPFNFTYTAIINVLGLPATACPLGLNRQGLPIGIQIVGGLYQDRLTLAVAEELERVFGGWVSPSTIVY